MSWSGVRGSIPGDFIPGFDSSVLLFSVLVCPPSVGPFPLVLFYPLVVKFRQGRIHTEQSFEVNRDAVMRNEKEKGPEQA